MGDQIGSGDTSTYKAAMDVGLNIKVKAVALTGAKEVLIVCVIDNETIPKFGSDLIGRLANGGADRSNRPGGLCSDRFHGFQGCLDDPTECAFPPGMGRSDNARLRVSKQDRHTVCRQNCER